MPLKTSFAAILFPLFLAIVAGGTLSAQAQTTEPTDEQTQAQNGSTQLVSSNWQVACQPNTETQAMICELSNAVTIAQSNQLFMRLSIGATPRRMVLQLPHGLNITTGILLQVDEKPAQSVAYTTSNQNGIFSNTALSDTLLSAMRKGNSLSIKFSAAAGNEFTVPISLIGFSLAFDKLN